MWQLLDRYTQARFFHAHQAGMLVKRSGRSDLGASGSALGADDSALGVSVLLLLLLMRWVVW